MIFALDGTDLGDQCALVADGQLSGLVNRGLVVGEMSPEAVNGGTIGVVEDGDTIINDPRARSVVLDVPEAKLPPGKGASAISPSAPTLPDGLPSIPTQCSPFSWG